MAALDDPPCVSVVMIFRDPSPEFFDEAIRSVLAQTQPGVELLLCDDGSQSVATTTAQTWAGAEPHRIRWLEHPAHAQLGMSATRNLGIGAASAPLIAFLDADDLWLPGHLQYEIALLARHPGAAMVCGPALDWYSWNPADNRPDRWSPVAWPAGSVVPPPRMLTAILRRGAYRTPTCSLLVRRDLLIEVGGAAELFTTMYEDQALMALLYLAADCVISGGRTAYYRRHAGSSSALAELAGTYHPRYPNPDRYAYLRWLVERPELAISDADHVELRSLVEQELDTDQPVPRAAAGDQVRSVLRTVTPAPARAAVRRIRNRRTRPVRFGDLRRTVPFSRQFGYDRGQPVDRYFIEAFLAQNAHLVAGRVLEVGDGAYSRQFGGCRVERLDVLNVAPGEPETTIVGDLSDAPQIASEAYDCLVITQTLHLVWNLPAAAATLHRILKPGGTLLATVPGISPISTDRWADTWYWSLTHHAAGRLFETEFGDGQVEVATHGNLLTSVAFLEGLASHELTPDELADVDPQFPMLVTIRADRRCD